MFVEHAIPSIMKVGKKISDGSLEIYVRVTSMEFSRERGKLGARCRESFGAM